MDDAFYYTDRGAFRTFEGVSGVFKFIQDSRHLHGLTSMCELPRFVRDRFVSDPTEDTLALSHQYPLYPSAILKSGKERLNIPKISDGDITALEQEMDAMDASLPQMTHFVLPGGHTTV